MGSKWFKSMFWVNQAVISGPTGYLRETKKLSWKAKARRNPGEPWLFEVNGRWAHK